MQCKLAGGVESSLPLPVTSASVLQQLPAKISSVVSFSVPQSLFIVQKHGDVYRLVGEAYVHGVMDGEAIEMWKRGELEEVDIQLF
jgi:hypothetical protein